KDRDEAANAQATTPGAGQATNIDQRLGAKGQTDYTPGRESSRDFPRRSRSFREQSRSDEYQNRGSYRQQSPGFPTQSGFSNTDYGQGRTGSYGARGRYRSGGYGEDFGNPYSQTTGVGGHDIGNRYGAQGQREAERGSYNRSATEDYGRESYRRENTGYANRSSAERGGYADPFNRDTYREQRVSGYGRTDYNQGYESGRSGYRGDFDRDDDYDRDYGRDYDRDDRESRRRVRASDIMTKDVTTCSPRDSIRQVADQLESENVGSLPVVDNGRLVGIITDRDIVCRVIAEGRDTRNSYVADAMSEDLVTCWADDSLITVINRMGEHQIRRMPVVDTNGRLRGIIAIADIALEAEDDREVAEALEEISRPTPNRARR
ncbi:MAG TPA: CBS domain-containing protein, partial [Blastocatellia bacterium]|nr:CBS domain-containing protein [Blastocatellia bacterium]